jgi:hypothetical protein
MRVVEGTAMVEATVQTPLVDQITEARKRKAAAEAPVNGSGFGMSELVVGRHNFSI